jgi:hypothetical protein
MNYFAHAYRFLDDPLLAVGTAIPDWLVVADRPLRVRTKHVEPFVDDPDPCVAAIARGMRQHYRDDARFHETRAFAELTLCITVMARDVLAGDPGFRPSFLGHVLVELLLDASLLAERPSEVDRYYEILDATDAAAVQAIVNRMAPRPTARLAPMIGAFRRERILRDYLDDPRLLMRLNQIMRRVGLPCIPARFATILPEARRLVAARRGGLLERIPVAA